MIERIFKLTENKISIRTEALAGVLVLYFVFVRSRKASAGSSFLRLWSERERRSRGRFNCSTSKRRNPPTERIPEVKSRTRKHQDRCVRPNAVQYVNRAQRRIELLIDQHHVDDHRRAGS